MGLRFDPFIYKKKNKQSLTEKLTTLIALHTSELFPEENISHKHQKQKQKINTKVVPSPLLVSLYETLFITMTTRLCGVKQKTPTDLT